MRGRAIPPTRREQSQLCSLRPPFIGGCGITRDCGWSKYWYGCFCFINFCGLFCFVGGVSLLNTFGDWFIRHPCKCGIYHDWWQGWIILALFSVWESDRVSAMSEASGCRCLLLIWKAMSSAHVLSELSMIMGSTQTVLVSIRVQPVSSTVLLPLFSPTNSFQLNTLKPAASFRGRRSGAAGGTTLTSGDVTKPDSQSIRRDATGEKHSYSLRLHECISGHSG